MSPGNEARKENAKLSTGPKTPEGKLRTKFNARTHNLSGRTIVGTEAEMEAYFDLSEALSEDLQPVGALETILVQAIADAQFQFDRTTAMQQNLLVHAAAAYTDADDETRDFELDYASGQVAAFEKNAKQLELLARYGRGFHRQVLQNQTALAKAKKERRENEAREESLERARQVEARVAEHREADLARLKQYAEQKQAKEKAESSFASHFATKPSAALKTAPQPAEKATKTAA